MAARRILPAEIPPTAPADLAGTGAWHAAARDIARGASRHLRAMGCAVVAELPLADGRRADLMALDPRGVITILEVKSCLNDFRTDQKWEFYRQWCDRFYFAVDAAFPQEHKRTFIVSDKRSLRANVYRIRPRAQQVEVMYLLHTRQNSQG